MVNSELSDLDLIEIARRHSVQERDGSNIFFGTTARTGLLPPYGTLQREYQLKSIWQNDYNTLFKGAIMGLSKRIASTPFEIKSPEKYGDYWRNMLLFADLGSGWSSFIQKLVMDFSRYDRGAFIEIIATGEAHEPIITNALGIAILDPLRIHFSGDSDHPIWYYGKDEKLYKLHYSRVVQLCDMPESDETHLHVGYCALSRAISPVYMEILLGRYTTQLLDDNPPAGFVLFRNISDQMYRNALEQRERERNTDFGGEWGRIIRLYQLQGGDPISVEFVSYSQAPEKFDFAVYLDTIAKRLATAIGIDIQDLWELTGGTLGSGMQSEIMNRKARGKTLGLLYSQIERLINQILPEDVTFEFKFDDPTESVEKAQAVQMWASVVSTLSNDLTVGERRQLLANSADALRDVLTDKDGNLKPFASEPVHPDDENLDNSQNAVLPDTDVVDIDNASLIDKEKSLGDTISSFAQRMNRIIRGYFDKLYDRRLTRMALRALLSTEGEKAYLDGKVAAGGEAKLTKQDEIELSSWRSAQDVYLDDLLYGISRQEVTPENLMTRVKLWISKSIKGAFNLGMSNTNINKFYMWQLGATKEHCATCLKANGQIHRMRAWKQNGILPQSSRLQCGGWNCDCRLVLVEGARLFGKGNLRAVRMTLKHHEHEHHEHEHHEHLDKDELLDRIERLYQ